MTFQQDMLSATVEMEDILLDFLSESWLNGLNEFWIMKNLGVISGMALIQQQTSHLRLVLASRKSKVFLNNANFKK